MRRHHFFFIVVAVSLTPVSAPAGAVPVAPRPGFEWNARLRHEAVNHDAFVRRSDATSPRLRTVWRAPVGNGFGVLIEVERIAADGSCNSGCNGRTYSECRREMGPPLAGQRCGS